MTALMREEGREAMGPDVPGSRESGALADKEDSKPSLRTLPETEQMENMRMAILRMPASGEIAAMPS